MFGDTPTSLDASAYPIITNALVEEFPSPLLEATKSYDNFGPYVDRCRALWFA